MEEVKVVKLNEKGEETWRYKGTVLERTANSILLEAFFNRDDLPFNGMIFARGDLFIELYYKNRWYNVFEIYDIRNGDLKGWYCNVCAPAEFGDGQITYRDLALDLLVFPDGRQMILDKDEFDALHISQEEKERAMQALKDLQALFSPPITFRLIAGY
jgi:uncharacterized protein